MRRIFRNRWMEALAKTVLCCAAVHVAVILVYALRTGDIDALNVFTILAAERLFPGLGAGAGMLLLSVACAACVYGLAFALSGRRTRHLPVDPDRGLVVPIPRLRPTPWIAAIAAVAGVTVHMGALALIERFTTTFPSVPDVLLERLPYVNFGIPGELAFVVFLVLVTVVIVRSRNVTVAGVFTQLGLFYAVRGLFLFLHPIGSPADAPPVDSRIVIYPFPSHAYFPGGHVGIMTILSLSVHARRWRWAFLSGTALFALGTMLARTHYTADALAGSLLGYAIVTWARRHLDMRVLGTRPGLSASLPQAARAGPRSIPEYATVAASESRLPAHGASTKASPRRRWNSVPPARLAGLFLLFVWVGPVTFVQTDAWQLPRLAGNPETASADSRVVAAGNALLIDPGTILRLRLRDGTVLKGRFLGRTLLDSTMYAPRFETHVRSSSYVLLAIGETLRVSLRDGREWTAPFAGYGELTLLLRHPDGSQVLRVPFEFAREIRRENGERVEPRALASAFRAGKLPSAEAVVLADRVPMTGVVDEWASALRVAVEDIVSAGAELSSGKIPPGIVVLGVVATMVAIIVLASRNQPKRSTSCNWDPNWGGYTSLEGVHLTPRPFDLDRGCYVGDALAVADPWHGSAASDPPAALADPPPSDGTADPPPAHAVAR